MSGQKRATGPFGPSVNAALETCFGQPMDGLSANFGENSFNAGIGAEASTSGNAMSFGSNIAEDISDPFSMEVIGHEVAHALAGGGSGATALDAAGDPGEAKADVAGREFAKFMTSGGPAPSLTPASGGLAEVHRFESSEHKDTVDGAADRILLNGYADGTLSDEQRADIETRLRTDRALQEEYNHIQATPVEQRGAGHDVDPAVVAMMNQPVMMENGVELTPGEITAMMGDFYGVFDEEGMLDPVATFQQMSQSNPDELRALQSAIARETAGEHVSSEEWEGITRMRREDTRDFNGDGVADNMTYLDLASRNDAHFSGETMEGADNNMGTYAALHQAALDAAAAGDSERARGLEAASMHYVTDRHASGHAFDKQGVMEASGGWFDMTQNLYVKGVHDHYNEDGMDLTNGDGESWRAYGDGHWADDANAANRVRTSESIYSSYAELQDATTGARTPEQIAADGFRTQQTVGQFSEETQEEAEQMASDMHTHEALWNVAGEVGLLPYKIGWGISDGWDASTDWIGGAWDTSTDAIGGAWDTSTDWAGDRLNEAGSAIESGWNTSTDWAGDRLNEAGSAIETGWNTSTDWAGDRMNEAGSAVESGWNTSTAWAGDRLNEAGSAVESGWNTSTSWAGDRLDDAGSAISSGWSSATEGVGGAVASVFSGW